MIKACFTSRTIEIHFVRSSKRFAYILDYSFHLLSQRRISVGRVKKKQLENDLQDAVGNYAPH